jgi:hypothetical protein
VSNAAPQEDEYAYLDRVLSKFYPPENPYLDDPIGWVQDKLKEFMWSKQREIFNALRTNRYVAVKSAHDTGKSHSASRFVCYWEDTREDPFASTTAPTTKQVHAILWRYIGQAHRKGKLLGRLTLDDEWYAGPGDKELIGFGRKPADHDQSAFQGIHALNPLIVVDEACGVPKSIFDAVDALATNSNARVLAIGNPDNPSTHFAEICKPGSGWVVITVDGLQTPNFTEEAVAPFPELKSYMEREGVPYSTEEVPEDLRPLLIAPEWVEERIKRWGINSPLFASKVRGEFPDISDDTLIMPKWIEAAQKRDLPKTQRPKFAADIARMGEDETVVMRGEGGRIRVAWAAHKLSTMETTGHLVKLIADAATEIDIQEIHAMHIDADGLGAGVFDRMIELGHDVAEFRGGMPAMDPDRFANRRAECYWMMREDFENGDADIDPDDDILAAQLGSIKWSLTSRGQIKIESKDDMRKRGMPSPDRADGAMMLKAVNDGSAFSTPSIGKTGNHCR